jgi:hypothetical protein
MCSNDPPHEPEDPNETLGESSGTARERDTTPDTWCGGDWCPGDILLYRQYETSEDAHFLSWSFMFGLGASYFVTGGVDVVWTSHGLVVFMEEPVYLDSYQGRPYSSPHNFFLPLALGDSTAYGDITSAIIREDPTSQGIRAAWSGYAIQEGGSVWIPVAINGSSSADSAGNPNFQTTSTYIGLVGGLPVDVHQYITNAVPYWELNW